ncbi:hypothetical protein Hanom_Chr11g00986171 [Helianthus anomalus]
MKQEQRMSHRKTVACVRLRETKIESRRNRHRNDGDWSVRSGGVRRRLDGAALAATAFSHNPLSGDGYGGVREAEFVRRRKIRLRFITAELTRSRIIRTRRLNRSIKRAKPHTAFFTWISDLSCVTAPRTLADAAVASLGGAIGGGGGGGCGDVRFPARNHYYVRNEGEKKRVGMRVFI